MTALRADAVVLDVEGTTGSLTQVRDVLFPFARARLADFFTAHLGEPRLTEVVAAVRRQLDRPDLDEAGVLAQLTEWSDNDTKAAPLKTVQSWIWADGYARGELRGHVYPEVPAVLRSWRAAGVGVFSYSSGAVPAQRLWYRYTAFGDLTPLFSGMFDLDSAGPKQLAASYRRLRGLLGDPRVPPVFLSDTGAELDAACAAGWQVVGVRRDGDPRGGGIAGHRTVPSLDRVALRPAGGSVPAGQVPPAADEPPHRTGKDPR